jgi:hypothetical protein
MSTSMSNQVHTGQFYGNLGNLFTVEETRNLKKLVDAGWSDSRSDTHTTKSSLGSKYYVGVNMGMPMESQWSRPFDADDEEK